MLYSPHLTEATPEVPGHFSVEQWVETGVGVGQHMGYDLKGKIWVKMNKLDGLALL